MCARLARIPPKSNMLVGKVVAWGFRGRCSLPLRSPWVGVDAVAMCAAYGLTAWLVDCVGAL